nr:hypothetical protein [Tanacetum cinerariifolium]
LQFCDYHNMVAILDKTEHNLDFHPIVDFVEASPLMYALTFKPTIYVSHIRQFWSIARIKTTEEGTKILATVDGIHRTVTKSSLRQYIKRVRIAQSSALPPVVDEPASPLRDVNEGKACPTKSGFEADQDMANIAKTSTLPHDLVPRVTSPAADEGSMQLKLDELTGLCTSLQRQHSEMVAKFEAQEMEINRLKAKVKLLEDRDGVAVERFGDDAPIKGRNLDEGEAVAERVSDDTKEMATVLTSMETTTVLASRAAEVPTGSGLVPTAGSPAAKVPTGSDVVPTAKSETPKKKKVQEQIDAQVARELEEQMAREDQRMSKQVERFKRKGIRFKQENVKKLKTSEEVPEEVKTPDEVPEEKVKEIMQLVPIEEVYVEALQVKHLIIDWKVHTEGQRSYWKIMRLGGSLASHQFFVDLLKHMEREDLNQLWALVKDSLSNKPPTSDKEMELWVELKRLYEPDDEDQLWTHTQNQMHAPVEWKLYDMCGVHQVTSKDKEIFILVEKDYPLRKGLAIVMIYYKLQVENYSQMANDLILKIYKIVNCPSQQGD